MSRITRIKIKNSRKEINIEDRIYTTEKEMEKSIYYKCISISDSATLEVLKSNT